MSKTALTDNLRKVNLVISIPSEGADFSIGAYKAVIDFVERTEIKIAEEGVDSITDLSNGVILKNLNNDSGFYLIGISNMRAATNDYGFNMISKHNTLEEALAAYESNFGAEEAPIK